MSAPSPDSPIRVDWLDATELGSGGRLGMTILPGKHGASLRYPGLVYRRDLADDLDGLLAQGVRHLLLLVDDEELARWGDPDIVVRAAEIGLAITRRPLRDGTAPATMEAMDAMLAELAAARTASDVAVACMGGVGRSGTVAACALVAAGASAAEAIRRVRVVRHPTAVETEEQVAFVEAYERHVAERGGASYKVAR
ncbi:MAG TPA: protein-tyrosine phosphatase family protein [Candidatus Limnocylindria bacterium]|nr:protein-tyrosine phosphatase family protein [Candidatus Limnocylindria bacterium]